MKTEPGKRLKIGLVLDDGLDKPDGVQQYILAIGGWLANQGHEVHYLVGQTSRSDIQGVHSLSRNAHVRFNGNRMSIPLPTSRRKLRSFLQKEKFDILHIQVPYSPFMAHRLILAANSSTAVIGTFHIAPNSGLVTASTKALGIWLRRSLKRFDLMFSVSQAAADFALQTFKVHSVILPNVIDYARFHKAEPFRQYQDKRLTILFLGRLVPRKGCLLLLKAVHELANQPDIPPFKVLICGTGPLGPQLKRFVKDNQLAQTVEFIGFVKEADKPRYYASADISVFPSNGGESFGIVLLEAMSGGTATVLAGDNSGYRSVLSSKTDLLFDPGSYTALAAKMKVYLLNNDRRNQAAAWGTEFTRQFDINVVGEQLLSAYVKALHKRRKP